MIPINIIVNIISCGRTYYLHSLEIIMRIEKTYILYFIETALSRFIYVDNKSIICYFYYYIGFFLGFKNYPISQPTQFSFFIS